MRSFQCQICTWMEITKHDAMKVLDTKVVKLSKFVKA